MTDADKERSKEVYHTLPLGKKIQYIVQYYRVVLILIAAGIAILIWAIYKILHPDPTSLLEVTLVEAATPLGDEADVFDRFFEENGYNAEEEEISVTVMDSTTYTSQLLMARLMTGEIDLLAGDEDTAEMLVEGEGLLELEELLPDDVLEEYADSLYYAEDPETGEEHAYAVLLPEGNVLVQDGYYADAVYVGIAYTAEHPEMAEMMIEYLLEQ